MENELEMKMELVEHIAGELSQIFENDLMPHQVDVVKQTLILAMARYDAELRARVFTQRPATGYKADRMDIIGQNGNEGTHYDK